MGNHNHEGNCWHKRSDVCHRHNEPRGACEECPECPGCSAAREIRKQLAAEEKGASQLERLKGALTPARRRVLRAAYHSTIGSGWPEYGARRRPYEWCLEQGLVNKVAQDTRNCVNNVRHEVKLTADGLELVKLLGIPPPKMVSCYRWRWR